MSLVSIIMPYYKKEFFIRKSIQSILNQTYKNFEIILINDEQTVKSYNFLNEIANLDSRIKLFSNEKNLGVGLSRNMGIEKSTGEFIAFCDCDDLWKPSKLEIQLKYMKKYNSNFSFTAYEIIDENEKIIGSRKAENTINFDHLINSCDIGLSTVLMKKNFFNEKKYKFPSLTTKEDYVLWLKLAKNGVKMIGINQNLSSWRKSKNSLSSSIIQKLLDGYKVYRVYLEYGRLKSIFCLINLSINFIIKK